MGNPKEVTMQKAPLERWKMAKTSTRMNDVWGKMSFFFSENVNVKKHDKNI